MSTVELILTDFDGVILDSNTAKIRAFEKCFSIFPRHLNEVMNYHLSNLGCSRFEKFEHIYRHILNREYSESEEKHISERFSEIVYSEVMECAEVPGARRFLQSYTKFSPIVVISATPVAELTRIIRKRNLDQYFSDIIGAETKKADAIKMTLANYRVAATNAVFIGDTNGDLSAAKANDVPFIGRKDRENFDSGTTFIISNLDEIAQVLKIDEKTKSIVLLS